MTRRTLAQAEEEAAVYHAIQTEPMKMDGAEWASTSAAARELVSGLLEKDPHKRYTIEQALAHPWVAGGATDAPISRSIVKSMQNFNRRNKFKKNALKLIARYVVRARDARLIDAETHPTPNPLHHHRTHALHLHR